MVDVIHDSGRFTCVSKMYVHDFGQKLRIWGLQLPSVFEAHFNRKGNCESVLSAGTYSDGCAIVPIPDEMFAVPCGFECIIYLRSSDSGESEYKMTFEVRKRTNLPAAVVNPSESQINYFDGVLEQMQGIYDQTKAAKNEGFKVMFTSREISMDPVTYAFTYETACDKTLAEIWEAFSSGQYVYAEHKILRPADPNSEYPEGMAIENGSVVSTFYCNVIDGRHDSFTFGRSLVYCSHPDDLTIPHSWFALVDNLQIYFDYPTSQEVCSYVDTGTTIPVLGEVSELFPVTFDDEDLGNTTAAYSVTCDKTFSQVKTAIENGKHVFAVIRKHYGQTVSTYYYPMLKTLGTSITFGSITPSSVGSPPYSRWEIRKYVLESSGATAQGYNESFARKGDFDELSQRTAEKYKVTVEHSATNRTTTSDKTFAEIEAAINAGKHVFIECQFDGSNETRYMPLIWHSDVFGDHRIRFGTVKHYNTGFVLWSVEFLPEEYAQQNNLNPVSYAMLDGNFAGKNAFDALAQRVDGLSASGVGEDCEGIDFEYVDAVSGQTETITGAAGAERYNDYGYNKAIGTNSHAEGYSCEAWGSESHAEGYHTRAGDQSTFGECDGAHAEGGYTIAKKEYSHAEGHGTIAGSREQHVQGRYNIEDEYQTYADIIGNGTGDNARSNAQTTSWSGVLWTASDVRCGGDDMDDQNTISLADLAQRVADLESRI